MRKIDIIILHYGDIVVTKKCVESIEKFSKTYRNIYVINNDVRIDINKKLAATGKRILVNSGENLGFASGVNKGIELALENKADYVVLLNNDTTIGSDFILPLYTYLEKNKKVGIVGPVIKFKNENNILYDHGGILNNLTGSTYHDNKATLNDKKVISVEFISGCCMMIKKELITKIGYFDERYFMYYEDVDFCIRTRSVGYKIVVIPDSIISHALSKTIGKNSSALIYHLTKSRLIFIKSHNEFPFRHFSFLLQLAKFIIKDPRRSMIIGRALLSR